MTIPILIYKHETPYFILEEHDVMFVLLWLNSTSWRQKESYHIRFFMIGINTSLL